MDSDIIDELIVTAAELYDIDLTHEELNDDLRQTYVDIAYDAIFVYDAITNGEDYYARNINKKMAAELIKQLGK